MAGRVYGRRFPTLRPDATGHHVLSLSTLDHRTDHAQDDELHHQQVGRARMPGRNLGAARRPTDDQSIRTSTIVVPTESIPPGRNLGAARRPTDSHALSSSTAPSSRTRSNQAVARDAAPPYACPRAGPPSPTTDSSPRPPTQPPVWCRPSPTTPSRPSARGRSRCAPRASAPSRSRSRWRARGSRSG